MSISDPARTTTRLRLGLWIGAAIHLVALAVLAVVLPATDDDLPVESMLAGAGAAYALAVLAGFVVLALDARDRSVGQQPMLLTDLGLRGTLRVAWRPYLVWAIAQLAVLGVLFGTAGVAEGILLAVLLVPIALMGGYVTWLFALAPLMLLVRSLVRLARPGTDRAATMTTLLISLVLLSVLPLAVGLVLGVEGANRWDWVGPLFGAEAQPDRIRSYAGLWTARVAALVLVVSLVGYLAMLARRGRSETTQSARG